MTVVGIRSLRTDLVNVELRVDYGDVAELLVGPGTVRIVVLRFRLAIFLGRVRRRKRRGIAREFQCADDGLFFGLPAQTVSGLGLFKSARGNVRTRGDVDTVRKYFGIRRAVDRKITAFGKLVNHQSAGDAEVSLDALVVVLDNVDVIVDRLSSSHIGEIKL